MKKVYGTSPDYYKGFEQKELLAMLLRCEISGCQFGIEGLDKEPKDNCIWCGQGRPSYQMEGVDLEELIRLTEEK